MWYEANTKTGQSGFLLDSPEREPEVGKCRLDGLYYGALIAIVISTCINWGRVFSIIAVIFLSHFVDWIYSKIKDNRVTRKKGVEELLGLKFICYRSVTVSDVRQVMQKLPYGKDFKVDDNGGLFFVKSGICYSIWVNMDGTFSICIVTALEDYNLKEISDAYGKIAYIVQQAGKDIDKEILFPPIDRVFRPEMKDYICAVGKMLIILGILLVVVFHGRKNDYIQVVQTGELKAYEGEKIGDVLESNCKDPEWNQYDEDGDIYVSFSGRCWLFEEDNKVRIKIIFVFTDEDEKEWEFKIYKIYVDGEKLNNYEMGVVIEDLFER